MKIDRRTLLASSLGLALPGTAAAATPAAGKKELTMGLSALAISVDPHYSENAPSDAGRRHIFEALMERTADSKFVPTLATSWRTIDDLTWEFKLRRNVHFHDGSEFTSADVIATMQRIPRITNSPSSFKPYMGFITGMEAPDPYTVIFKTAVPFPVLVPNIAQIGIIPKTVAENASKEDFDSGKAAIGTGPYRFGSFVSGDTYGFVRNDNYWGKREPWEKVTGKVIPVAAARTAALLAGDIDLIERPNLADLARFKKDPQTSVAAGPTYLVIYLAMDQRDGVPPGVSGTNGRNPFRDVRVRRAFDLAIDREAIVNRIMDGHARVATQLVPAGYVGYDASIPAPRADTAAAKKLLAEAGYPDGFDLVLSTSNDRFANDALNAQAVAQMLTRAGVRTKVDAMPVSTLFARRLRRELCFYLAGWGDVTGEALFPLQGLVSTRDDKTGIGSNNFFEYSNKQLDTLVAQAAATIDDTKRIKLLQEAMHLAITDHAVLTLHVEEADWATRKSVVYAPRADTFTMAMQVTPA